MILGTGVARFLQADNQVEYVYVVRNVNTSVKHVFLSIRFAVSQSMGAHS